MPVEDGEVKEFNDNGELIVYYNDDSFENLGLILKEGEDSQGLEFYPLLDVNYGVKSGRALLSAKDEPIEKIVIPATFNGKPVTKILEGAFYVGEEARFLL